QPFCGAAVDACSLVADAAGDPLAISTVVGYFAEAAAGVTYRAIGVEPESGAIGVLTTLAGPANVAAANTLASVRIAANREGAIALVGDTGARVAATRRAAFARQPGRMKPA